MKLKAIIIRFLSVISNVLGMFCLIHFENNPYTIMAIVVILSGASYIDGMISFQVKQWKERNPNS